jgi:nucleoside-triphosphatase THEP1
MKKNLFISGNPRVGKTTLIKEVCLPYWEKIGGFYTEEFRKEGERWGFLLKTFSNQEAILAQKKMKGQAKLGKYGIDLKALEKVGVEALEEALAKKEVIVIDEIGQMEIFSDKFREILVKCLNSEKKVLATIRLHSQPFTDEIKKFANTEVLYLNKENYPEIKLKTRKWLESILF